MTSSTKNIKNIKANTIVITFTSFLESNTFIKIKIISQKDAFPRMTAAQISVYLKNRQSSVRQALNVYLLKMHL